MKKRQSFDSLEDQCSTDPEVEMDLAERPVEVENPYARRRGVQVKVGERGRGQRIWRPVSHRRNRYWTVQPRRSHRRALSKGVFWSDSVALWNTGGRFGSREKLAGCVALVQVRAGLLQQRLRGADRTGICRETESQQGLLLDWGEWATWEKKGGGMTQRGFGLKQLDELT